MSNIEQIEMAESPLNNSTEKSSPEIIETPPTEDDQKEEVTSSTSASTNDTDIKKLSDNGSEEDVNSTIHPFNLTNCTVIEKNLEIDSIRGKSISCEGSDSGVEINENTDNCIQFKRTLSSNSGVLNNFQDFDTVQSCDSSISYCSNYDEAYNILVRRNSSLFEDCTLRNAGDRTSENGSESSSITGSSSSRNSKRNLINKRKVVTVENKTTKTNTPKERARSKPPITPRNNTQNNTTRLKSLERTNPSSARNNCLRTKQVPNNLEVNNKKEITKRPSSARTPSNTRTPSSTPTDDGRWPSVHSKPAPLLSKTKKNLESPTMKRSIIDTKTIEKYATLPRRRKEKSAEQIEKNKKTERENSTNRTPSVTKRSVPRETLSMRISSSISGKKKKIKIYQESGNQTALTLEDIDKALSGQLVRPASPEDKEFNDKDVQVDMRLIDVENLQEKLKEMTEKHDLLLKDFKLQAIKLKETEEKCRAELLEKQGLEQELKQNTERVLTILGENNTNEESSSDSLMVLETRYQNVSQVVLEQENEISRLNVLCRSLQINLEQTLVNQRILVQQHKELEAESLELQEFMQAEKCTLADALRESEAEIKKTKALLYEKEEEFKEKQEGCTQLLRLGEKRRQENLTLQAKLGAMEAKCRDLLVQHGSSVSGTAVALSALSNRLDSLANELIASYNISEQELEDVIFHNEVYNNSSSDTTPERGRKLISDVSTTTKKSSSFVAAVINAIRNNTPFSRDISRSNLHTETSSSNEMLDSETEPCLMMEHVLEDVIIPDGHSHNMISSTHSLMNSRLTHSESLKDLSQIFISREKPEQPNSLNASFTSEMCNHNDVFPITLIDQVIDVDNSITRFLKVIRIIQVESEDCMNELEDHRECLSEQIEKQKETNKFVVKQLKDWEFLGARLKTEVKDLKEKLVEKDSELEKLKIDVNKQREQLEKQNQDVCELSTALSKIELDTKLKEEQVNEAVKIWEKSGEMPSQEILGRIISLNKQYPEIKELIENQQHREELKKELTDRQLLTEKVQEVIGEAKKQYEAIDNALEVLHNVQTVVQQCPPLAKLQRDLEEISFQTASKMPLVPPPDFNANAALLKVIKNLEIASPINTTA